MPDVLLYDDPFFERHLTGSHPECPERLQRIRQMLTHSGLLERCLRVAAVPAQTPPIERIHTSDYLDRVARLAESGGGFLDPDTHVSRDSYDVALRAAGTALDAVDRIMTGEARRALCLVRPPGHHALSQRAMGFCLLNNIAIAATYAHEQLGLDRILIVDWDVHHGNGTQDIFYVQGQIHFFSVHRFPFYPGSGSKEETGSGAGLGATTNLPLPFGISRRDYRDAFTTTLESVLQRSQPDLILLSAGFDAHAADPIGSLGLESEDFALLTEIICDAADQYAQGRIISLLEGGYHLEKLPESVAAHLSVLLEYGHEPIRD